MLLISIIAGTNISSMFPPHFPAGLIRLQVNSGANEIRQKTSHGNQITTMEENYDPLEKKLQLTFPCMCTQASIIWVESDQILKSASTFYISAYCSALLMLFSAGHFEKKTHKKREKKKKRSTKKYIYLILLVSL